MGKLGGELGRVRKRVQEHKAHAKHGRTELLGVAEHAWGGHALDWTPRVLDLEQVTKER